jgi:GNAT superfamily N-acetyltransferase
MADPFHIRRATPEDIPVLHTLIDSSVRGLQAADYTPEQIEGALGSYLGVDSSLIADGTYFVVETGNPAAILACGGWSRRRTLCGADARPDRDDSLLDPATEAAKIRAFFVHPDWARRGLGTLLLAHCEAAAAQEGFTRLEMGATLTGVPLYRARGYSERERLELPLPGGGTLPIIRMTKGDFEPQSSSPNSPLHRLH